METVGLWSGNGAAPAFTQAELLSVVHQLRVPVHVVQDSGSGALGAAPGGRLLPHGTQDPDGTPVWPVLATLPPSYPEWLGDRSFCEIHRVRFPYVSGAMANGIATTRLVIAMARAGFLGFFGAAGLGPATVEQALDELERELGTPDSGGLPWGANLIHSPNEPAIEERVADLYVRRGVRRVSAAAYMGLTPHIVRYAYTGLGVGEGGQITRRNHVFAKISRPEIARHFLEPAPAELLDALVAAGKLTVEEGQLARQLPVAEDFTVESDSGGHTDNRPLTALLPTILSLRDEISRARGYRRAIRVGAAGGLGTPGAVSAAFALGASYVLTGSVNQACVESGLDADGRQMLAEAGLADVVMAPAADMFELGVEVQVLKRGTFFGARAKKLYELYRAHDSLDTLPAGEKARLEKDILRVSVADAWRDTSKFWQERDPREIEKAEADPKHKMALVFRSYLGQSSGWAIAGVRDRRMDYQIWCGPAMGAFNAWTAGSFLAEPENRSVVQVARNLLEGAAVLTRAQQLRSFGVPVPPAAFDFRPRPLG
ncbi:MAG: PfaD family polyunsaturated fatty acid/polyketide biosynthesis protein [Deltaproteobacteria bacterium]|nr:PfaD family polyunsaturated fatty acid/polyketide biosynthesis protein [Deltaproteobacteria bacterium]MBW2360624.1 PfaD family polyunsaturated fatty acid/polyketide biosynthesis protein [Deltaproteobacteria bacterium]